MTIGIIIVKEEKLVSRDDKDSSSIYYKVFDYMVIFVPELNPKIFAIILSFPCDFVTTPLNLLVNFMLVYVVMNNVRLHCTVEI